MISIIIPTCNRSDLLQLCLKQLEFVNQGLSSSDYEVIVSDDGKDTVSKELIETEFPEFQWVKGPQKGPAANRNNGAKNAKGEWLLFLDDDVIPDKNIIKEYKAAIQRYSDVLVFEGCTKVDRPRKHFLEEAPINVTGGYLWSCNFMIYKSLFLNNLNGFDEKFPYAAMEDVDLRHRIQQIGNSIFFLSKAIVIHPWRFQTNPYESARRHAESCQYFYYKHPQLLNKKNHLGEYIWDELRFYKNILVNGYHFGYKGLIEYIKIHIFTNKLNKTYYKK